MQKEYEYHMHSNKLIYIVRSGKALRLRKKKCFIIHITQTAVEPWLQFKKYYRQYSSVRFVPTQVFLVGDDSKS